MLLNIGVLARHPEIPAVAVAVIFLKGVMGCLAVVILGLPLRIAVLAGLALCQIGEFSFILSRVGMKFDLVSPDVYQVFLAVAVLTMGSTPFIMQASRGIADRVVRVPLPSRMKAGSVLWGQMRGQERRPPVKDHVIVVGFGLNGQRVAQAAKITQIPYVIVEMNPEAVKREQAAGENIFFGDATHEAVLKQAGVASARVLVVTIPDPVATRGITATARRMNPALHIIARTRFFQEMAALHDLGANEVIPEEFETSVEILTRVLSKYLIPRDEIEGFVAQARADGYQMFRSFLHEPAPLCDLQLHVPDVELSTVRVQAGAELEGKTLAETDLRQKYGVTLLAIRRGSDTVTNPAGDVRLVADDILVILSTPGTLSSMMNLFAGPGEASNDGQPSP